MESTQAPMLKRVKPINFLFFRTETTVEELKQFFEVAPELYKEAVANNLTVTGPVHWHYIDFYGDIERPFTLEIALPVSEVMQDYEKALKLNPDNQLAKQLQQKFFEGMKQQTGK